VKRQIYINSFLISLLLSVSATVFSQYCTPCTVYGPHPTYQMFIESVELEDISYQSTSYDTCYTDLTKWGYNTNLGRGESYSLTVQDGASAYYSYIRYAAWIDYNNDLDFEDAGEKLGEQIIMKTTNPIL